ncbi:MAG: hypothetical protein KZQ93_19840 [Candidatus Thiodiazotropha sp. (ex Monitilora ramsayi)]|nr:hypothetical protein [Candidatus Thiodiazotropha sp. (ex Monitilora ramsayi)]
MTTVSQWCNSFASALVVELLKQEPALTAATDVSSKILARRPDGVTVSIDLTPVDLTPQPATAAPYFAEVSDATELISAYRAACTALPLEWDDPDAMAGVSLFAAKFRDRLLSRAKNQIDDIEAQRIGLWLSKLDIYTAVKALESLANSDADRALLAIAEQHDWIVHLDHLAIRCGSEERGDACRVVQLLRDYHGYIPAQAEGERCYRFDDGWDAYPLYKLLDNGCLVRMFVDESSAGNSRQIIQHWNRVYGYTPHHLAFRVCEMGDDGWQSVPITVLSDALRRYDVETMTPTGGYTAGLLQQVFTRPSHTPDIPAAITAELAALDPELPRQVENGKLIELVARREMRQQLASSLFDHYGLGYQPGNPDHSAPVYSYFLPAQAAHVIRTSVEAE